MVSITMPLQAVENKPSPDEACAFMSDFDYTKLVEFGTDLTGDQTEATKCFILSAPTTSEMKAANSGEVPDSAFLAKCFSRAVWETRALRIIVSRRLAEDVDSLPSDAGIIKSLDRVALVSVMNNAMQKLQDEKGVWDRAEFSVATQQCTDQLIKAKRSDETKEYGKQFFAKVREKGAVE